MSVRLVDKWLGAAVVFLGVTQCLSAPYFFRRFEEPAAWFFAGGMLLAVTGALSLLRSKYGGAARGVRHVSIAASAALGVFWIVLYWGLADKFARHPASFAGLFVVVAHAVVSALDARRARR